MWLDKFCIQKMIAIMIKEDREIFHNPQSHFLVIKDSCHPTTHPPPPPSSLPISCGCFSGSARPSNLSGQCYIRYRYSKAAGRESSHSSEQIFALQLSATNLCINKNAIWIAICLCLRLYLCKLHSYHIGEAVDAKGLHGH